MSVYSMKEPGRAWQQAVELPSVFASLVRLDCRPDSGQAPHRRSSYISFFAAPARLCLASTSHSSSPLPKLYKFLAYVFLLL